MLPGANSDQHPNCLPILRVMAICLATATRPLCGGTDGRVVADQLLMVCRFPAVFNTLSRDWYGFSAVLPVRHGRCKLEAH